MGSVSLHSTGMCQGTHYLYSVFFFNTTRLQGQDHSSQWATSPEVLEPLEKIKKAAQSQQETLDADYLQHIQDLTRVRNRQFLILSS